MTKTHAVHDLTVAEIARLTADYERQRRAATEELAGIFASRQAGQPEPAPLSDGDRAARDMARTMLNGWAPADFAMPSPASPEQQLIVRRDAIDLVLGALRSKEAAALAEEGAIWLIAHGSEWRELCRDILLTADRLRALEAKAVAMRQGLGGAVPVTLPLGDFIGTGRSLLGVAWGTDPLSRARTAALAEKVVSARQIEDCRNV